MNKEILDEGITKIESGKPGPTVAVFAGVHGNEVAGILALKEVLPELEVEVGKGTVYAAFANPPAIEKGARELGKNLNRCFVTGSEEETYEDERAKKLMGILDKCDALLDLHAFRNEQGPPFIICEEDSLDIAMQLEPEIVSTNWTSAEPGAADGYMYGQRKPAICLECGPASQPEKFKDLAKNSIYRFLAYYGLIEKPDPKWAITVPKRIIRAEYSVTRNSKDLHLDNELDNFQKLKDGQLIGSQAGKVYRAQDGEVIIFPMPEAEIGEEAFIIGKELP